MRVYRLVPMLVVLLLLTAGQSVQMIDWAYAACCNIWKPGCVSWSALVYGRIVIQDSKAIISIDKKEGYKVEVSQDVVKAFKEANLTSAYGFIVLSGTGTKEKVEVTVTAFVPAHPEKHDSTIGAEKAVKIYNKRFEDYFEEYQKKGTKQ